MSLIVGRLNPEVEERSKVIRQDFKRRYNLAELREQLYREQDGICAICKKWMQDSSGVICAVDHATSVYIYASWNGSIEEACEHANELKNLAAAHVACNTVKQAQDLEEFHEKLESREIVIGEIPIWSEARVHKLMDQLFENSRKAGLIGGRKTAEKVGHMSRMAAIAGRKNVESGRMVHMQSLPQTKEARIRTGRILGRKSVENGQLARLRTPEHQATAGRAGGLRAVESGQLASICRDGGRVSGHKRWHVNRGISKPDKCALCAAATRNGTRGTRIGSRRR